MKIDLHVHLDYRKSIKENIDFFSGVPIDGIGLCGFRDIIYIKEIKDKLANKVVIIGQEIFTESLHIVALGLEKKIDYNLSVKDTISCIHSQGALAIAAHPMLNLINPCRLFKELFQHNFDAIEGFNGLFGPFILPNFLAKATSKIRKIPYVSVSDAHRLKYVGSSYIEIPGNNGNDISKIFKSIQSGEFTSTKKGYISLYHYKEFFSGLRCLICRGKLVFKREFSDMCCYECRKIEKSNLYCSNGHYLCEICYFAIH